jgi:polysaccharide export outer membrane protein
LGLSTGCSHSEPYVWATEVSPAVSAPDTAYLIQPGDLLAIRAWEQENLTSRVRVRPDGRISFPLLNELQAAGKRPADFALEIEETLRAHKYLNDPHILVNVEEQRPTTVLVLGEVLHNGSIAVGPDTGVLQAIVSAGGLTDFADRDGIYVIRKGLNPSRIRFRFEDLTRLDGRAAQFRLKNDDIVQVE